MIDAVECLAEVDGNKGNRRARLLQSSHDKVPHVGKERGGPAALHASELVWSNFYLSCESFQNYRFENLREKVST